MQIGTCGWSYLPKKFVSPGMSRLTAYAKIFDSVEITSTFYQMPKTSTARAWRKEVDAVNPNFEFSVKIPKLITHVSNFSDQGTWEKIKDIAEALRAKVLVFQTPKTFAETKANIKRLSDFFKKIDGFEFALEPRGWSRETIETLLPELGLKHIVDPFSEKPIKQKFNYYRLHGRGNIMYRYRFKEDDLDFLKKRMKKKDYLRFNNIFMYDDAMRMIELVK
ncbi:MAG: DUF72 domain-containing protein [Candidatus Altiarchaeota archaeon]|nr:DUF72 domain-containing protein [Candidatus Altiarchaeota archaeon]